MLMMFFLQIICFSGHCRLYRKVTFKNKDNIVAFYSNFLAVTLHWSLLKEPNYILNKSIFDDFEEEFKMQIKTAKVIKVLDHIKTGKDSLNNGTHGISWKRLSHLKTWKINIVFWKSFFAASKFSLGFN